MATSTADFRINVKVNEVEIITLETLCSRSTTIRQLKQIIARERNISKWEFIELKCNGDWMQNDQTLSVYDVICDKHLIYLELANEERAALETDTMIQTEGIPDIDNPASPPASAVETRQESSTKSEKTVNINPISDQKPAVKYYSFLCIRCTSAQLGTLVACLFFMVCIVSYSLGIYGYSALRATWKATDIDFICPTTDITEMKPDYGSCNLPLGGQCISLIWSVFFLFCVCIVPTDDDENDVIFLCMGMCYFLSMLMATVFSSIFLFGDDLSVLMNECEFFPSSSLADRWDEVKIFCFFPYALILFQFLVFGLVFFYSFLKSMFES